MLYHSELAIAFCNRLASNIAEWELLQYCEGVGYCGIASVTDIVLHKSVPVFAEL